MKRLLPKTQTVKKQIAILLLCWSQWAWASVPTQVIDNFVPNAKVVGSGRFSVLFWDVYDAALYAPDGKWQQDQPYALALTYLRDLDGEDIAKRSIEEMRKQGLTDDATLSRWQQRMAALFPDVEENTVLTGIADEKGYTQFYQGEQFLGSVEDADFTRYFFGIWLSENTSEPKFRKRLLNGEA